MYEVRSDDPDVQTEFDPTTQAVLNTLDEVGVSDDDIRESVTFLYSHAGMVMVPDAEPGTPAFTRAMSCLDTAWIGLLIHSFMPVHDVAKDTIAAAPKGTYRDTLMMVVNSAAHMGVTQEDVDAAMSEVMALGQGFFIPAGTEEDKNLLTQFLDLMLIGIIIHRHFPMTTTPPTGL